MQLTSGDIPKNYDFTASRPRIASDEKDSDTALWFLMALSEYFEMTGDLKYLDDSLAWYLAGKSSLWEHAKRAFSWITEEIGTGAHGLIRMLEGDWNDYFSKVGAAGRGESAMNSGMAAWALERLARIARQKGDGEFALLVSNKCAESRQAVGQAFDHEWFIGCYSDVGKPITGQGDRIYLNAQSWAVLGKCGTQK